MKAMGAEFIGAYDAWRSGAIQEGVAEHWRVIPTCCSAAMSSNPAVIPQIRVRMGT